MPRLLFSSALVAAALIGPARSSAPVLREQLRVASCPDSVKSRRFRLTAIGAGEQIAGSVTLAAGRDTILATPVGLDLEPGAAVTLDASGTGGVSLVILPDSGGDGSVYQAGGGRSYRSVGHRGVCDSGGDAGEEGGGEGVLAGRGRWRAGQHTPRTE